MNVDEEIKALVEKIRDHRGIRIDDIRIRWREKGPEHRYVQLLTTPKVYVLESVTASGTVEK